MASCLFEGYRALALVSDHVPAVIRYNEKQDEMKIITSVGKSFNVYGSRLQLLEASLQMPDPMTVMDSDSIFVFTAAGKKIYAWKQGHKWLVHTYAGHKHRVICLIAFGQHIVSVDDQSNLLMHEIKSERVTMRYQFLMKKFQITCMMHPSTYPNKILLGSRQGSLQLVNLKTQTLIYEFKGWNSAVRVMEQSPAVDIVGIGLANGMIVIHHLKRDESLMQLQQEWGPVVALSFRTDGPPFLASTSTTGHVAIWDLEKQRIASQMRDVHAASVSGCRFVFSQPLLITNSSDNSLRVWLFSEFDSTPRQLHVREGHSAPPTSIRFYDQQGHQILSSGPDGTLKSFSTLSQKLDRNFGCATFNRRLAKKVGHRKDPNRMSEIVMFAAETTREKEWDNVVTLHQGSPIAMTWSTDRGCLGQHKLIPERLQDRKHDVTATSVCVSSCGNFTLIGYSDGHVDRYNLQSGMHRQSYGSPVAHNGPVNGLMTDSLNQIVVTGASDSLLKFWKFADASLLSSIQMESSVKSLTCNRESSLAAVSLHNYFVKVVDLESRTVIRVFSHSSEITDMTFSADAHWLIVASMDKCIRVWDLPKGKMVDVFSFRSVCSSLSLSPNNELLATSHFGDRGIYLWSNISLYTSVSIKPIASDHVPELLDFPQVGKDVVENEIEEVPEEEEEAGKEGEGANDEDSEKRMDEDGYMSPEQIADSLVTLSLQPSSRWKNLLNLDLIRQRNRPKEPVKAAKSAPFFLPTAVVGLEPRFLVTSQETEAKNSREAIRGSHMKDKLLGLTEFGEVLLECGSRRDFGKALMLLSEMGPSAIDAEFRSLDIPLSSETDSMEGDGEHKPLLLLYFLIALEHGLRSRRDFELLVSYLSLFLRIHMQVILQHNDLIDQCKQVLLTLQDAWKDVDSKFNLSLSILNYLRGLVV